MKTIQLEITFEELNALYEMTNNIHVKGDAVEKFVEMRIKLRAAIEKNKDEGV
jgi:hypothetical protein